MEPSLAKTIIEALSGAGAAGVLAGLIFYMHIRRCREMEEQMSQDRQMSEQRIADICEGHERRLEEHSEQLKEIIRADRESRERNSTALNSLSSAIDRMNGRHYQE